MKRRIRSAPRVVLLLDFDGTLVGFKKNPAEVRLEGQVRQILTRLAKDRRVTLAVISGRRRADLRRRVAVPGAIYMGLHGFERHPRERVSAASRRSLKRALERVQVAISGYPGVWVEDKHGCVVLHYRGVPALVAARACRAARHSLQDDSIRLLPGRKMLELLPPEIKGKGDAACSLVCTSGGPALAIFAGDTETDEMAFEALPRAITVKVGDHRRTRANYYVRDPSEVHLFLERLEETLASGHKLRESVD